MASQSNIVESKSNNEKIIINQILQEILDISGVLLIQHGFIINAVSLTVNQEF